MMGSKKESKKQAFYTGREEGEDESCKTGRLEAAENRQDGLSLECAFCVYYEILRSLKPKDRLMFFKITSLVDHTIIFSELFNEEF